MHRSTGTCASTCTTTCASLPVNAHAHAHRIPQKFIVHKRHHFFIVWSFHYPKSGSLSLSFGEKYFSKIIKTEAKERESDRWTHAVGTMAFSLHSQRFWPKY